MKSRTQFRSGSIAVVAIGLLLTGGARAQLCFDVFSTDDSPLLQCADTDFFIAPVDGGFGNLQEFTGSNTGSLSAAFDGADLFDPADPDFARPDNVLEPFFSSVEVSTTGDASGTSSFTTAHRGSVSMAPADSVFQSTAYGTRSRITFMPVNDVDRGAPITMMLDLNFTFSLTDPLANMGAGAALGGLGVSLTGANDDPFDEPDFDISALAELDIDGPTFEPEFFGFDDPDLARGSVSFDSRPSSPEIDDQFEIDIDIQLELDLDDFELDADEPIILELDTFGSIFSDGFESGDVSAWRMDSSDTFTFTVSSPDPNVRFILIPEPSAGALLLLASCGLILRRQRS